jgi:hypothetical protein
MTDHGRQGNQLLLYTGTLSMTACVVSSLQLIFLVVCLTGSLHWPLSFSGKSAIL